MVSALTLAWRPITEGFSSQLLSSLDVMCCWFWFSGRRGAGWWGTELFFSFFSKRDQPKSLQISIPMLPTIDFVDKLIAATWDSEIRAQFFFLNKDHYPATLVQCITKHQRELVGHRQISRRNWSRRLLRAHANLKKITLAHSKCSLREITPRTTTAGGYLQRFFFPRKEEYAQIKREQEQ